MKGFFTKEQTQSKSRPNGKTYSCASCGLYRFALNPRMNAFGKFKKGILNIGEAPGEIEDWRGKQWQGKMGRRLQRVYNSFGIDLFEDCLNINAVNCRPSKNKTPTNYEIACCRQRVFQVIKQYQPRVIILLGNAAIQSVIGSKFKKELGGITKWRGWTIPDRDLNAWICPIFHPSYVDRNDGFKEVETIWKQDIKRALSKIEEPIPAFHDDRSNIEFIDSTDHLSTVLQNIQLGNETELAFFDYETTGLKPHARGHRIACAAIATHPNKCYAFMMPKKKADRVWFGRFLKSPLVGKGAANMKYEHAWSQVRLGYTPEPWVWDTMQAAHILDNRPGITSLKFQAYVQLGVADYDSHIESYLKGRDEKNANSMNRIFEFIDQYGEEELLTYCGLDALYEYQLGLLQMKQLGFDPKLNQALPV